MTVGASGELDRGARTVNQAEAQVVRSIFASVRSVRCEMPATPWEIPAVSRLATRSVAVTSSLFRLAIVVSMSSRWRRSMISEAALTNVDTVDGVLGIGGGQSKDLTVTLAAGSYTYICTLNGHDQLGMKGTLTVN